MYRVMSLSRFPSHGEPSSFQQPPWHGKYKLDVVNCLYRTWRRDE